MFDAKLVFEPPEAISTPALVTWAYEPPAPVARARPGATELDRWADESPVVPPVDTALEPGLAFLDDLLGGKLSTLAATSELTGKPGEALLLHSPPGLRAQRLLVLGAGKPEKFTLASIRPLAGAAARFLKARGVTEFTFFLRPLPQDVAPADAAQAAVEGVLLANFEPARYQTDKKDGKEILAVQVAGLSAAQKGALEAALRRGRIIAEAQNLARELTNEPSNRLTPRLFAERAAKLAREVGLAADILDENRLRELKMGAFLSVAQGSEEPPRLVVLTYT
ncbi:MAG: hypothetical protein HYY26_06050, partial [Acidobacteria bacterium]|nr:hypothetical protein [Acidobacteriota bacterium]